MLASYARFFRLATPPAPAPCPSFWRGKKKKAGKRSGAPTDLAPDIAPLVDLPKYEASMRKTIESLQSSYARMRSSGASPGMLDDVRVEAYGAATALRNVAQVSARDGRTLVVSVFDDATSAAVEKAIRAAGLNLNPVRDGAGKLKVPVPKQTEAARGALEKAALKEAEAAKVATRMVRRKAMDAVRGLKEDVGKDDLKRMENSVQEMADRYIGVIASSLDERVKAIHGDS